MALQSGAFQAAAKLLEEGWPTEFLGGDLGIFMVAGMIHRPWEVTSLAQTLMGMNELAKHSFPSGTGVATSGYHLTILNFFCHVVCVC